MKDLSLLEKLQILFSNIIAHPFFLIILVVPMAIMFLERDTTKKEKDVKKIILLIYIVVIAVVLFIGGSTLFELFDNVMDGLFMTLYFPNFITLFVVIIISAVICLITVFRKKMRKSIRITNFTGFAVVQTLFCLVLMAIKSNDIDIYKENALYSNSDVLTLMQLLMGAFLLQIVTVCVITLINRITEMLDERDNILHDELEIKVSNEDLISNEIKEKKTGKPVILQAKLVSLKDVSLEDKKDSVKTLESIEILEPLEKSKNNEIVKESKTDFIKSEPIELLEPLEKTKDNEVVKENKPDLMKIEPIEKPKKNKFVKTIKPDLMKPMEKAEDLRNVVLTISNLRILKTRKTIASSRRMKFYKKKIFSTYEEHPIENLQIVNFKLMIQTIKNMDAKKRHTNGNI